MTKCEYEGCANQFDGRVRKSKYCEEHAERIHKKNMEELEQKRKKNEEDDKRRSEKIGGYYEKLKGFKGRVKKAMIRSLFAQGGLNLHELYWRGADMATLSMFEPRYETHSPIRMSNGDCGFITGDGVVKTIDGELLSGEDYSAFKRAFYIVCLDASKEIHEDAEKHFER